MYCVLRLFIFNWYIDVYIEHKGSPNKNSKRREVPAGEKRYQKFISCTWSKHIRNSR